MGSPKDRNKAIIEEFRANGGKVGGYFADMPLLLLHTREAKSQQPRINPVACLTDGDQLVVFASKGGAPTNPDWYHNLVANPLVTVEFGTEKFQARATVATEPERTRPYDQMAADRPNFAEYQRKTTRRIPVIILTRISSRVQVRPSMIPETKQPAVTRALHEAFGANDFEDIRLLTGGLSTALAFKIVVRKNPYLLKILRTEVISDPAHEFACMQTAAEAGIAPQIRYVSVEDRVLITDFVEAKPFPDDLVPLIVPTLRRLHSLPHFPKVVNYFDAIDGFIRRFQAAKILPESATEELFRRYADVQKLYPRNDTDLVASHNDLKPQNIRFDGERIWLVDWESAFLNDEYVDLAIVANFFVKDDAQEEDYLKAYFSEPAGEYRRSRFYLMRQAVSMFYATLLLLEASRAGLSIAADMTTPDFREYHQDLISDKIDMMKAEAKLEYGMIHLREALRNMRTPRFAEAVARVGDLHANA